jgi:hypothetical protein
MISPIACKSATSPIRRANAQSAPETDTIPATNRGENSGPLIACPHHRSAVRIAKRSRGATLTIRNDSGDLNNVIECHSCENCLQADFFEDGAEKCELPPDRFP